MKNKVKLLALVCAACSMNIACDDNKDQYLDDFSTILSIKESGEVPLTLYKIAGEEGDFHLVVNKGGTQLKSVTSAQVEVMDNSALEVYNIENSKEYVALPANTYELQESKLTFNAQDMFKHINVKFKTENISDLPEIEGEYVLPIILDQSPDSINSEKNVSFLIPEVVIPSIYLDKTGYIYNEFADNQEKMNFKLPIKIPFTNKWDFDCTVAVDEALLDDFNKTSEITYSLLPSDSYTLENKVSFTPMDDEKDIKIEVRREGLSYGNYILPLALNKCSKPDFIIDEEKNSCLYGITYVPDMSKLNQVALTVDMLSSNSPAAEGSLADMLDGNVDTYFHTDYSGEVPSPHYLQVDLDQPKSALSFSFTARASQGNGNPAEIDVFGSMDGISFTKMSVITEDLPPAGADGAGKSYTSPVIVGPSFKYLRLEIPKDQAGADYFVFSEFSLKAL